MDYQSPTPSDTLTTSSSEDYESARSTTPPTRESSLAPTTSTSNHDQERDSDGDLLSQHLHQLNLHPSQPPPSASPPLPILSPPVERLRTCVIFQEACIRHKYIRNDDISTIVERPERVRAVKVGVSNAWARLEGRNVERGAKRWVHEDARGRGLNEDGKGDEERGGEELDGLMKSLSIGSTTTTTTTMESTSPSKSLGTTTPKAKSTFKSATTTTPTSPTPHNILKGPFDIIFSHSFMSPSHPALHYIHPLPNLPPSPSSSPPSSPATPTTTPTWPHQLLSLCRTSRTSILSPSQNHSEIPSHLPQGDLYLCPGSEEAIFGALGAVEEGVERVVEGVRGGRGSLGEVKKEGEEGGERVGGEKEKEKYSRAFVAIRPPGHHCGEDEPMGFCFVNNLAVGVAHAHQKYGIDRIVILDIDLHHGNGTQDIVWRINSAANEAYLKDANTTMTPSGSPKKGAGGGGGSPRKRKGGEVKRELQVHFASLHDVFSYPCEDGNPSMVQSASLNLSGGHSQYISNVHLEPWLDEDDFHERLYEKYREGLLGSARAFLEKMREREGALGREEEEGRTMIFVSAGFDASIHESAGMSRHRRNVPTSFYHRFSLDVCKFAEEFAQGKLVSILEGGYSDRALASSSLAMLVGMTEGGRGEVEDGEVLEGSGGGVGEERTWWEEKNLLKLEKGVLGGKKKVGRPPSAVGREKEGVEEESWLNRTVEIFNLISGEPIKENGVANRREKEKEVANAARSMQLRERKPRGLGRVGEEDTTPIASPRKGKPSPASTPVAPPPPIVSTPHPPPTLPSAPVSTATPKSVYAPPPAPSTMLSTAPQPAPIQPSPITSKVRDDSEETNPIVQAQAPAPKVKFTWREGGL